MAGSISSEEVGEALAHVMIHNAMLAATVEGLIKIGLAAGWLTPEQVDAINQDATAAGMRQFGRGGGE